jgi:hypothetical protein
MRFNIYKIDTQSEAFWGERRTLAEAVAYSKELLRSGGVSILDTTSGRRFTIEEAERESKIPLADQMLNLLSPETRARVLAEIGRQGGQSTSPSKVSAAKENGKKGGRISMGSKLKLS